MYTRDDIFREVLVRNNRNTTDGFITDTILKNWYIQATDWAYSYKKWPFTEGRIQTTFATGGGINSDEWYFEGYKANSFRFIQVGGKRLEKRNFTDYQILLEEEPGKKDRIWAEFSRVIYINPYADVSGTVVAYCQYNPVIDVTDETAATLFSGFDEEGNEALIFEMQSKMFERENQIPTLVRGKPISPSIIAHENAVALLDAMWQRVLDERFTAQTDLDRGGMFKRIDILRGRGQDELLKPNQFF